MRNDSEHVPKTSEANRRRGALTGAQPHRPKLTVSRKLWLGFGILLLLLLAGGIVIELSIRTIDANLKEITEIEEPESAAAFEMEVNLTGMSLAVLGYHHDRDPAHLAQIEENAADFARYQQQFRELTLRAENETELDLSSRIDEGYMEFTSLARDMIALEDLQFEKMGLFRQNLDQINVILNEQIQAFLDPNNPDSNLKLHTVHEMEISANGVEKELEDYRRTHDTQYAQRAQEDREEFERSLTMYESLGLSSQERQWADSLRIHFNGGVALAQEIIDLDEAEELGSTDFFQLRQDLDVLFAEEIRAVAQAELAEAKAETERSVNFAQWALLALLIASLGGGGLAIIIGRGISKPLRKLATGVEHVSRGDLSHVIDVDSSDEIGELASAFNRMTTNLALLTASRDELDQEIEERKQAEEALRNSEAKYRNIFENVQDIFYQTDMQGIIVDISPSVERFGYTRERLIGTQVLDIYENPEDRSALVKTILEHDEIIDYELRLKTGDGSVADASVSAHLLRRKDDTAVGIEGVLRDVSMRKQAERALLSIVEGTSTTTGDGFFKSLVRHLASALDVRYVLVGEVIDATPDRMKTLAVWAGDDFGESIEYCLAGTPCDNVVGRTVCLYASGVQKLFPQDHLLVEMEVESYLGTPLFDSSGRALGLLAVMDDKPMAAEMPSAQSMLAIFAARAGAELERKQAEAALERSLEAERERARRDPLTGVLNHGAISEELREQCSSAGESPVAVAMIDLDDLKLINDTYGHQVGDEALIIVANVLTRDNAIVGRYGGDEFIVILPGADRTEAERYRDVVTAELLDARLPDPESDARIPVVASWGLAVFPEEAETIVALIHLSDSAMYAAKRQRPVEPGQLAKRGPLGSDRAAEMVGQIVPLLTSPGDLNDKLRLVSHQLSIGAGYDAVDFSMFAPEPGSPLAQNTFAQGPNDLLDAWHREQQDDSPAPHPLRLLFERSPRPVILSDPWNDELLLPGQREILRSAGLKSVLVAPLVWQDHVLGSLGVANRQEDAFTPADAQFLMAVAAQVTAIMRMKTVVADLQASSASLSQAQEETVLLLAAAAEAHDRTTGLHLQGVRDLTEALARELGYVEADAIDLGLASVLHDIGKICVPDTILTSPAKLEGGHWETMKQHTIWGADFLQGHPGFELAATVALHHHEHWNGGGYPEGIAGDLIPEAATIVAVADAFDAITHNRPYRAGRSVEEAIAEICAHAGKQFNPKAVVALERLHRRNELPIVRPEVIDTETAA